MFFRLPRDTRIFTISFAVAVFLLLTLFFSSIVFADSLEYTTRSEWNSGKSTNIDSYSKEGDIKLESAGSWNPREITAPAIPVNNGSAFVSDGEYIYMVFPNDQYFSRYIPAENRWEELARAPSGAGAGATMTKAGNYIYVLFGGTKREFARYSIKDNSWEMLKEPADFITNGASSASDGVDVYVLKGNGTTEFWKYTVATGTWSYMPNALGAIGSGASLVYKDGGLYSTRGNNTNNMYKYTIASGSWSSLATSPVVFYDNTTAAVKGDHFYILQDRSTTTFYRYSFTSNTWETLAATPNATRYGGVVYVANQDMLYVVRSNGTYDIWKYDSDTNSFVGNVDLPNTPGTGSDLIYYDNFLYFIRGNNSNLFYRYNLTTKVWEPRANVTGNIADDSKAVAVNGFIYVLAANNTQAFYRYNIQQNIWEQLANTGFAARYGSALSYASGNYIYAYLGNTSRRVIRYDISAGTWSDGDAVDLPDNTEGNYGNRLISDGTYIYYVSGGRTSEFLRSTPGGSWTSLGNLPFSSYYGTDVTYYNGKLYFQAGYYRPDFWEYDTTSDPPTWRRLENILTHYGTEQGPYNGGSLESDGLGNLYSTNGANIPWVNTYSVSAQNYVEEGVWTSNYISLPYVTEWGSLNINSTTPGDSSVQAETRTSNDGITWSDWQEVSGGDISSPARNNIQVRLILKSTSDRVASPTVHSFSISYTGDTQAPTNPTETLGYTSQVNGAPISSGGEYSFASPYFVWTGATDGAPGSLSYYVYFGNSASGNPFSMGSYQTVSNYVVSTPLSNGRYYLRISTVDAAGNISEAYTAFEYVYKGVTASTVSFEDGSDFSSGTLTNMEINDDDLVLSGKGGFWVEDRLTFPTFVINQGSDITYDPGTNKLYVLRGSNTKEFYEYDVSSGVWTRLTDTPVAVQYGGSVAYGPDGSIYAFGGNNTPYFWMYDVLTKTWYDSEIADLPNNVYYGADLVYTGGDYIYAIRGNVDDAFYRYDLLNNSWDSLDSTNFGAPDAQTTNNITYGGDLAYDGAGNIYAIQGGYYTGFSVYNVLDEDWQPLTKLPAVPYNGAQIEYDETSNSVFFFPANSKPYFYRYDIPTQTWVQLADAPYTLGAGAGMQSVDGYIYITRGAGTAGFYRYSVENNSWMTPARGLMGALFQGSTLFPYSYGADIVKGDGDYFYITRGNFDSTFIRYNPVTGTVDKMSNAPAGFYAGGSLVYVNTQNKIYATTDTINRKFFVYDISTDTWSEIVSDPPPVDPGEGSSMTFDGSRYIYWARGGNTATFYRYDLEGNEFSRWGPLTNVTNTLQYGSQLVYKNGYIYTWRGGNATPNAFYRYNTELGTWATMSTLNDRVNYDGFLVDGGGDYIYGCIGNNTSTCYKYSIADGNWTAISNAPAQIYNGGAAASDVSRGKIYMIAGMGTNTYTEGLFTYIMETDDTAVEEEGTYISQAHDLGNVYRYANVSVSYTDTENGDVQVYTRSSPDNSDWGNWIMATSLKMTGTSYSYSVNSSANRYLQIKLIMESGDGIATPTISGYSISYYSDSRDPENPTHLDAYSDNQKTVSISSGMYYPHSAPTFDWPDADELNGATDTDEGSGVIGYYVYFDVYADRDPEEYGETVSQSEYTPSGLISGETYYLKIKAVDDAGNVQDTSWEPFIYMYDSSPPSVPGDLEADPPGYTMVDSYSFSWGESEDTGAGNVSYCYKTGASNGPFATEQCVDSLSVSDITSYKPANNTFYLRAKDGAGNYSDYAKTSYYFSSGAPAAPLNLVISPPTNTENSFAFSWQTPNVFYGAAANLTYYYSVNAKPTPASTSSTKLKSLMAGPFATLPGQNIFYVVAQDEAGNINWENYTSGSFVADTAAPGIPTNIDIADVSVKATASWKLALSWEQPLDVGAGVSTYRVARSEDNVTFTDYASTAGISFVDTRLEQKTYYYKVKACDNANNCGEYSSVVSYLPDGKFIESAPLLAEPVVSSITTRKATISWTTARTADSKIAYGTSSGDYLEEEVANSTHVTAHELVVTNLSPGTTYYAATKWTDEDGNTGMSEEFEFNTLPPPTSKEIQAISTGLYSTVIKFTSKDGSVAKIYYGKSSDFGGVKEISVGYSESSYTVSLDGLEDGTKYYYKVNLFDIEGEEYEGDIYSFETLPEPKISDVKIAQVKSTAAPTLYVVWTTNTDASSIVTYYPQNNPSAAVDEVNVSLVSGKHRMVLKDLLPEENYTVLVSGRDKAGNEAKSDLISFTTASDTRPPLISGIKIEGAVDQAKAGSGEAQPAQLIVSWKTDEPATSQVEFGEGSGTSYSQKTQEDMTLSLNHRVVITNLTASKVYHLRVVSNDKAGNVIKSIDNVTITPKATADALDLVVSNLSEVFGFLGDINK